MERRRRALGETMSRSGLFVIGQFVLFGIMAITLVVFPLGGSTPLRIVGLVLIVLGFAVLTLAIWEHMRRNATLPYVTPTPNRHVGLVDSGLYAYVRHPIYSGVLTGAVGVALAHGHLVPMIVALVMIVFFTFKSRHEESLLRAIYPEYAAYMTHTGRFLPFI